MDYKTLKQTRYSTPSLLFNFDYGVFTHASDIEKLIVARYGPYEICMEDEVEWHDWFKYLTYENMAIADALYESMSLIVNPLNTTDVTTTGHTDGTEHTESTTESANATSGYSHDTNESEDHATSHSDGTNKVLDTPQGRINNLNDGYLTSANITGANAGSDGTGKVKNDRSYLDANSANGNANTDKQNGSDSNETRVGFEGANQAEILKNYRETLTNIKRQITDLWAEAFIRIFD